MLAREDADVLHAKRGPFEEAKVEHFVEQRLARVAGHHLNKRQCIVQPIGLVGSSTRCQCGSGSQGPASGAGRSLGRPLPSGPRQ